MKKHFPFLLVIFGIVSLVLVCFLVSLTCSRKSSYPNSISSKYSEVVPGKDTKDVINCNGEDWGIRQNRKILNHTSYHTEEYVYDAKDESMIRKYPNYDAQKDCFDNPEVCANLFFPVFENGLVIDYKNFEGDRLINRLADILWSQKVTSSEMNKITENVKFQDGKVFLNASVYPCCGKTDFYAMSLRSMRFDRILQILGIIYRFKYNSSKEKFLENVTIAPHAYKNYEVLVCDMEKLREEMRQREDDFEASCWTDCEEFRSAKLSDQQYLLRDFYEENGVRIALENGNVRYERDANDSKWVLLSMKNDELEWQWQWRRVSELKNTLRELIESYSPVLPNVPSSFDDIPNGPFTPDLFIFTSNGKIIAKIENSHRWIIVVRPDGELQWNRVADLEQTLGAEQIDSLPMIHIDTTSNSDDYVLDSSPTA